MYSSDGVMTPEQLVTRARATGLDGLAVTDHGTIRGALELARLKTDDLLVIVGAEMMTDQGEVIGLFLREEVQEYELERVVEAIRRQGGIAVVPHPFDSLRKSAFPIGEEQAHLADAIEVFNSRCLLQRYNRQAREYAARHGLPGVAGSDAHYPSEVGTAGVIVEDRNVKDAIQQGRLTVFGRHSSPVMHMLTKARKIAGRLS
jgi:predicted metal-dependent phosphoesterase TrpH